MCRNTYSITKKAHRLRIREATLTLPTQFSFVYLPASWLQL